jgi:hypothetical protein
MPVPRGSAPWTAAGAESPFRTPLLVSVETVPERASATSAFEDFQSLMPLGSFTHQVLGSCLATQFRLIGDYASSHHALKAT